MQFWYKFAKLNKVGGEVMEKRFELTIKEILEKEFHIDLKGYNAHEVDSFLDCVISDYQHYDETIKNLGENLCRYEEENKKLKQRIQELEVALQGKEITVNKPVDHLDVIKRLSRLEQEVFKKVN